MRIADETPMMKPWCERDTQEILRDLRRHANRILGAINILSAQLRVDDKRDRRGEARIWTYFAPEMAAAVTRLFGW